MTTLVPEASLAWTVAERAEIILLRGACGQTEHWRLECSRTEAGDPWCIIFDERQRKTIVNIARIDHDYVVVWPSRGQTAKVGTMAAAVELALARTPVATPAGEPTADDFSTRF